MREKYDGYDIKGSKAVYYKNKNDNDNSVFFSTN